MGKDKKSFFPSPYHHRLALLAHVSFIKSASELVVSPPCVSSAPERQVYTVPLLAVYKYAKIQISKSEPAIGLVQCIVASSKASGRISAEWPSVL